MKHYHGTPMGGKRQDVARILQGRYALIPFGRIEDLPVAAEVCRGFCFDNGAFTAWRKGEPITDWHGYYRLCYEWRHHPRFEFALIPDVIDGTEADNDELLNDWPRGAAGVPVWHLHESIDRLKRLARNWLTVALGSSGVWATPGTEGWWQRMDEAMAAVCGNGRPNCKLHGLRMLDPAIFTRLPLASADSTNVAQNKQRPWSTYEAPTVWQKAEVLASRIEAHQSAAEWVSESQLPLFGTDR
jgi:hypothetical protein